MKKTLLGILTVSFLIGWINTAWSNPSAYGGSKQSTNFFFEVGADRILDTAGVNKFGENPDIDIASGFEVIWDAGGDYVPPTQARIHDIASTSVTDTGTLLSSGTATGGTLTTLVDTGATFVTDGVSVGDSLLNDSTVEIGVVTAVTSETVLTMITGIRNPDSGIEGTPVSVGDSYRVVTNASTGASIFFVTGIDITRLQKSEFVILNGTTTVVTASSYVRQFRARVFGPGTVGAVGIVSSTAQTDSTISCQVINGNNQTLMAVYTVPLDKVAYIVEWWASLSKKQAATSVLRLKAGILDGIGYIVQVRAISSTGSSDFPYIPKIPILIPGGADIWVEADSSANDSGVASGFDIILEDK